MLRAIFAGLRKLFGFAFGVVQWPFTWFFASSRRQNAGVDMATVKAVEHEVAAARVTPAESLSSTLRDSKRDAQIAWSWIATALLTREIGTHPSALSEKMCAWLRGLDHRQLTALRDAGADGVLAHSIGQNAITGVPAVRPMSPVTVVFPRTPAPKPDAELSEIPDFDWSPA